MSKIKTFFFQLKKEFLSQPFISSILIFVIILGGWLRLYNLQDTLMFQGDQGRDAIIVANIFRQRDLAFIGPVTSIGNMYLGPFYYYFMLPFLWLSYPNPIGPAVGVALFNTVGIALFYFLGRQLVGRRAALWSAILFAFSRVAITYSRFSWNPNLSAVCALLALFFTCQSFRHQSKNWLWVGLISGILIQLHYVNLIIIAICGCVWLFQLWQHRQQKNWFAAQHFWRWSFAALGIFLLTAVPLFLFDWKHDWRNAQAAVAIFSQEESFSANQDLGFFPNLRDWSYRLRGRTRQIVGDLALPNFAENNWLFIFSVAIVIGFLILTFSHRHKKDAPVYFFLAFALLASILIISLYRHSVYDHYLLFAYPIIFLVYGCLLANLPQKKIFQLFSLICFSIYIFGNYQSHYFTDSNHDLINLNQVTDFLLQNIEPQQTFGFSLISDGGDSFGEHYRYFLESKTDQLLSIDQTPTADVLFVVDETTTANLNDSANFNVVIFRQNPDATLSALPYDGPAIYKYEKIDREGENYE